MSKKTEAELELDLNNGIIKYELKRPTAINGTEYKEITLDLYNLNGDDIASAEFEMMSSSILIAGPAELNKTYLMHIAARAAKIPFEVLKQFSIKDVSAITMMTQTFLMQP